MKAWKKLTALLLVAKRRALRRRTVAVLDNGSWAATAGKQMRQLLAALPETTLLDETVSLRSALTEAQLPQLTALADVLAASVNA